MLGFILFTFWIGNVRFHSEIELFFGKIRRYSDLIGYSNTIPIGTREDLGQHDM